MSSNLYSDIYILDGKNIIAKETLATNYMKSVFNFDGADEHLKKIEPVEDVSFETVGYISPEHLNQIRDDMIVLKDKDYILTKSYFDSYELEQNKIIFQDKKDGEFEVRREVYYSSTAWTNVSNLSDYIDYKRQTLAEKYNKLSKLNGIKDTVDYYKLNEESKNNLVDDINFTIDFIEVINNEIDSCNRLIGSIDSVYDRNHNHYDNTAVVFMYIC